MIFVMLLCVFSAITAMEQPSQHEKGKALLHYKKARDAWFDCAWDSFYYREKDDDGRETMFCARKNQYETWLAGNRSRIKTECICIALTSVATICCISYLLSENITDNSQEVCRNFSLTDCLCCWGATLCPVECYLSVRNLCDTCKEKKSTKTLLCDYEKIEQLRPVEVIIQKMHNE